MKTYLKIAWRNLWRNKRRTLITGSSVAFGLFFAAFMTSVQQGSLENMVDNMVRFYTGYLQIQSNDFKEFRNLNNSFQINEDIFDQLNLNKNITDYTSRIESFALASNDDNSYPSMVLGIDPDKENKISGLSKWIQKGSFLTPNSSGVILGKELAKNLNISLGDTLVLIGQGYHGVSAASLFPVEGILNFPLPEMNKQVVYMNLSSAMDFYSMPDRLTSIIIMVENMDDVEKTKNQIMDILSDDLEVYSWNEIQEGLESLINGKLASGKIIKGILFMVIGFGIWGTIIMLMSERKRELGIMIALGVRKIRVIWILLFESFFIGILGIMAGILSSFPLLLYLYNHPIHVGGEIKKTYEEMGFEPVIKFTINPEIFISPAMIVLILFTLICIYPIWFILNLKTANALRA
jgi:ABC-type lipoprotein release transport system permease subunit